MNSDFTITNKILCLVAEIAELIGAVKVTASLDKNPTLRRKNRIQTIHGSLAIEQNTLTIDQVTAVINGKAVIAPPKDIEEVKNAFEIYELLDTLNPFSIDDLLKAHGVMMRGLVSGAGEFRDRAVGVVDSQSGEVIHLGTLPAYVPETVAKLMRWLEESDLHPLIKSCIFHYEFELIHPFLDGNGRCVRLWHTLILSKWNSLFAWLPIESMVYRYQQEYYDTINRCNEKCDSTDFVEFMLEIIKTVLEETIDKNTEINAEINAEIKLTDIQTKIVDLIKKNPYCTLGKMTEYIGVNHSTVERHLKELREKGYVERSGSRKSGRWILKI